MTLWGNRRILNVDIQTGELSADPEKLVSAMGGKMVPS